MAAIAQYMLNISRALEAHPYIMGGSDLNPKLFGLRRQEELSRIQRNPSPHLFLRVLILMQRRTQYYRETNMEGWLFTKDFRGTGMMGYKKVMEVRERRELGELDWREEMDLEDTIDKLLGLGQRGGLNACFKEQDINNLCNRAREVFATQPAFLELGAPIKVCGDVHGQYADLLRLLNRGGFPPSQNYLFLGDYVDRGKQNLETISLLMAYKCKYPDNFFLLRGNHECAAINRVYGFYDECRRRYTVKIWKTFQDMFNMMPFCALIEGKIFCMHGGLSPEIKRWEDVRNIQRPVDPPDRGMLTDLLWSDPDKWVRGWQPNTRGVSYVFGTDVIATFCNTMDIDLVARAHQVVGDGYEFFAGKRLVTIFSAPHYCGEFDNSAGMMNVDENLMCSFEVLRPSTRPLRVAPA